MILTILLCVLLLNHLVTQVDTAIYMLNVKITVYNMKINKEYRTDERNISFREYISEVKESGYI